MRRALLWAILALTACTDRRVELSFELPRCTGDRPPSCYADRVDNIALRVLIPPTSVTVDCERLAFGEVDADTIAAATIEEVIARDPQLALEVPREGRKLFWFQANDSEGLAVAAACGEIATIDGEEHLDLSGEPATIVTSAPLSELGGAPFPASFPVAITDIDGFPVADAELRWTIVGPGGQAGTGAERTSPAGVVNVEPVPPQAPGPAVLTVRSRWNRSSAPRFVGYEPSSVLFSANLPGDVDIGRIGDPDFLYVVGRIGPSGEPGFAAQGMPEQALIARPKQIMLGHWNGSQFVTALSPSTDGVYTLGHVTSGNRDVVVAINGNGWNEFAANGSVSTSSSDLSLGPLERVTHLFSAGSCDSGQIGSERIVAVTSAGGSAVLDDGGGLVVGGPIDDVAAAITAQGVSPENFLVTGCVAGTSDAAHPTLVFKTGDGIGFAAIMDTTRLGTLPIAAGGIGFSPAVGAETPRLLATELSLNGTSLRRLRLTTVGTDRAAAETVDEDPTPVVPLSTAGGDVDGDGLTDIVAILGLSNPRAEVRFRLLIALGIEVDGQRIVGLSEEFSMQTPRLRLYDFDGDGDDDILLGGSTSLTILEMGPR